MALADARLHARQRATSEAMWESLAASQRSMAVHKRLAAME